MLGSCIKIKYQLKRKADLWIPACAGMTTAYFLFADPLENNKAILEAANAAIAEGNHEGFLSFCTDETEWAFVRYQTRMKKRIG